MINIENLRFSYAEHEVLKGISLKAEEGQVLCVLGPNGVGKSTLFKCILGLLKGYTGSISIDGVDAEKISAAEKAGLIAYIPQASRSTFSYKVIDMVMMGTVSHTSGLRHPGKKEREISEAALERLGISHLAQRNHNNLSGGEQQLVLIARALAQGARTLVMDEPTSSLDYGNKIKVQQQMRSLAGEGYAVIQSTHDPEQTYLFADRIVAMLDGRIYREGKPSEILDSDLIKELYGIEVKTITTDDQRSRFFEPKGIL